ncbi:S8 family serine peptidase [Gottfriedia acidiceleris]|uniref:S8 family serine peptidase n=1 Tax=Gottfriedia acidiceleris TaxID=371036 RepID=UPI00101CC895|nr:S8 family serine peptidase [Gottfriedia acidiceleris]
MKKYIVMKVSTLTLGAGLLTSSLYIPNSTIPAKAVGPTSAESILAKMTLEQKQAINKLQTMEESGLMLSQDTNLDSDAELSVIVQFKSEPAKTAVVMEELKGKTLSSSEAQTNVENEHKKFQTDLQNVFKKELAQKKSPFKITKSYKRVFNGVAMTLPANKVKELLQSDAVKAVWSNAQMQAEPPIEDQVTNGTFTTKVSESSAVMGVDKLHQEGYTGKGIKVGVIDTGIDYNHPDLKAAYKGGYDFVDNDNDPMETTYDDWNKSGQPEDSNGSKYYTVHGTHVAGIIAGQGTNKSDYAVTGIAPEADLYSYRVLGAYGRGTTDNIIAAIDKAVTDGMDVINLSLGSSINDSLDPASIAINNSVLAGVVAVVAAGNSGNGLYTLGTPGSAALALTVGASSAPITFPTFKGSLQVGNESTPADLRFMGKGFPDHIESLKGKSLPIMDVNYGFEQDYINQDVTGKIVLMRRNDGTLTQNIKIAIAKGAAAIFIWNDNPTEGQIPILLPDSYDLVPVFSVNNEQGLQLKEKAASNNAVFSFNEMGSVKSIGDLLADFSSRGPARPSFDIKPEVTAPGVAIMSTVPSYNNGPSHIGDYQYSYARLSGTSMATPNVTGVAALMLQANPNLQPEDVKTTLMNTADPLAQSYSVYEEGAGRVDAYEAVHADTQIQVEDKTTTLIDGKYKKIKEETGEISFGLLTYNGEDILDSRSVTLQNNGKQQKTFNVDVHFQTNERGSKDAVKNGVKILTDSTVKVKGNSQKKATLSLFIPKSAEKGPYEGYIVYTNQNNPAETYQVPFAVRYVEEGIEIDNSDPINPMFRTLDGITESFAPITFNGTGASVILKSPMKSIDLVLVDAKTNKEIGYVGTLDGTKIEENVVHGIGPFMGAVPGQYGKGYYYPFTNNPDEPILSEPTLAESGQYYLKFIATSESGKTYTANRNFLIDNTPVQYNLNQKPGIIEVDPEQTSYTFSGKVFDKETEEMFAAGLLGTKRQYLYNIQENTIASNDVYPWIPGAFIYADDNGYFQYETPIDGKTIKRVSLYLGDYVGTGDYWFNSFTFIPKGTSYIKASTDKQTINTNDSTIVTLTSKHMKNFTGSEFTVRVPKQLNVEDIKVNTAFADKGQVNVTSQTSDSSYNYITITVKRDGSQMMSDDELPLVDLKVKVPTDIPMSNLSRPFVVNVTAAYGLDSDGKKVPVTRDLGAAGAAQFLVHLSYSKQTFYNLVPEGLVPGVENYNTIGANVKLIDAFGKEYRGSFDANGAQRNVTFNYLPLTEKPFTFVEDIPGHFTVTKQIKAGRSIDDKYVGTNRPGFVRPIVAGDVNKDNVIDILDAIYIQTYWGTNKRSADINFDGTVDTKDLAFVQKNFLRQNVSVNNPPTPKKKYKGITLEKILKELQP